LSATPCDQVADGKNLGTAGLPRRKLRAPNGFDRIGYIDTAAVAERTLSVANGRFDVTCAPPSVVDGLTIAHDSGPVHPVTP
jgi:hypothetical protein